MTLSHHPMEDFAGQIVSVRAAMRLDSELVHTERWQGVDIASKPEMAMHELRHVVIKAEMRSEDLAYYTEQIQPNLPWADEHFLERVCGQPINPGLTWKNWPWGHSAERFLDGAGLFNHNYMQRYWCRFAGLVPHPTFTAEDYKDALPGVSGGPHRGIYHSYGDLNDVVDQLAREPLTRQAILPVFFPEDTGAVHRGRIPCSLYYQFLMRNNRLDIVYAIRSCDFKRHFRDDIYLTVRLLLWMLDRLRERDKHWQIVKPGEFIMHIASLHCFRNDYIEMFK